MIVFGFNEYNMGRLTVKVATCILYPCPLSIKISSDLNYCCDHREGATEALYSQTSVIRASIIHGFWGHSLVHPTYMKYSRTSIIHTSIIRGLRLSPVFETKI